MCKVSLKFCIKISVKTESTEFYVAFIFKNLISQITEKEKKDIYIRVFLSINIVSVSIVSSSPI